MLKSKACEFVDMGDLVPKHALLWSENGPDLRKVSDFLNLVSEKVNEVCSAGCFPLILGGDHSISIGTLGGVAQNYANLGVIWLDAHPDLNTHETTVTGNIFGMALAASLGYGHSSLTDIASYSPKVKPDNIVLIGLREFDEGEKRLIISKNIKCFSIEEIRELGLKRIMDEALNFLKQRCDGIHLSMDLDVLDCIEAPGVRTPSNGGLIKADCKQAFEILAESDLLTSIEVVELNPNLDKENQTVKTAVDLITSLF